MIHDPQHTITTLTVRPPFGLTVIFADGETFQFDLRSLIKAHPSMHLLFDASLFNQARIDDRGGYVVWIDDDLELAADNLRNTAVGRCGCSASFCMDLSSTGNCGAKNIKPKQGAPESPKNYHSCL